VSFLLISLFFYAKGELKMELNISEKTYLNPILGVGTAEIYKIVANDKGDCVEIEKRTSEKFGDFNQYVLCLENKENDKRFIRYLMDSDLRDLVSSLGKNTSDWINTFIEVKPYAEEKGDKIFYRFKLSSCSMPMWAEEKV
jgi:hypothetical protein